MVLTLYQPLYYLKDAVMSPKLQASERFREVADFLREVLLLSNADFSKILFVNRAYEAIWGRTVESL